MKKLKFLLGALSFVAAALTVSPSQAQFKTYWSEDFEEGMNDTTWNLSACTPISDKIGPLFLLNDGSSIIGSYVYDPNGKYLQGGSNIEINGVYELISMPFSLDANVKNFISIDLYLETTLPLADRKFGIRLREKNSTEWDTVREISLDETSYNKSLLLAIDSSWAGKNNVELGLYFFNNHNAQSSFLFYMDNISCIAYSLTPAVNTTLNAYPMAYGDTGNLKLSISNASMEYIDSIEYTYTIDDTKTETVSVIFGNALAPGKNVTCSVPVILKGLELGKHTLKLMPPTKINGNTVESRNAPLIWEFTLLDEASLTQNYVPLMECFTASWCGPCASMNRYLNPTLEELRAENKINVIKYQSYGDSYYISASDDRCDVYADLEGYGYIPFPIYNGEDNISTWANYPNAIMPILKQKATEDHNRKALAAIEITKADANSRQLELTFSVTPAFSVTASVFAAVTEKTTTGNVGSNGEKEFHWVVMDMPTSGNGQSVNFEKGKTETFEYTVNLKRTHIEEITDLEVVCFVQNLETREIFQSASASVTVDGVSTANDNNEAALIKMYPNPAKGQVTLQGMSAADITICDLTGRAVYSVKGIEESLNINLDSFTAGTYMVLISQNGKTAHKKLVVVK